MSSKTMYIVSTSSLGTIGVFENVISAGIFAHGIMIEYCNEKGLDQLEIDEHGPDDGVRLSHDDTDFKVWVDNALLRGVLK